MKSYKFSYPKIANRIIEWGIIFLIVFTPIAFGTVHPWAYTVMELTICFLVTIWIVRLALININKTTMFPNLQSSTGSNRHERYSNLPEPKGSGQQLTGTDITPNSELPDLRSAKHTSQGLTPNSNIRRSTLLVNRFGFIKTPLTIPIIIFVGLILFQLTPLPPGVLKILSPNTYELYKTTLPDWQPSNPNQQLARMDTNTVKSLEQVGQTGGLTIANLPESEEAGQQSTINNHQSSVNDSQSSIVNRQSANPLIPQSLNPSIPQSWRPITVYSHATKTELYKILAYIGIFFLIVNYNPSSRSRQPISGGHRSQIKTFITRLIIVMIIVGCFESIYGLLEYLSGHQHIFFRQKVHHLDSVTGTYLNRNHFAGYMAIVICMSFGYLTYMLSRLSNSNLSEWRQKLSRMINLIGTRTGLLSFLILIMSSALILSGSRMGIFSFIIVVILMTIMISKKISIKKISIVILPVCLLAVWIGLNPVIKRFSDTSRDIKSESNRIPVWKDTSGLIKDFPSLGTGLGTYEYAFPKYNTMKSQMLYDHTHNDYLELISDTGFTGLIIVIAGAAYYLFMVTRLWFQRRNPFVRGITVGCLGGIAYIILHSFTDFNLQIPANALHLSIITGIMHKTVTQL